MYRDEVEDYDDKIVEEMTRAYGTKDLSELSDMLSEQNFYIDKFVLSFGKRDKTTTNELISLREKLKELESVKISDLNDNNTWLGLKTIVYRIVYIADKIIEYLSKDGAGLGIFDTLGGVFSVILLETKVIETVMKVLL